MRWYRRTARFGVGLAQAAPSHRTADPLVRRCDQAAVNRMGEGSDYDVSASHDTGGCDVSVAIRLRRQRRRAGGILFRTNHHLQPADHQRGPAAIIGWSRAGDSPDKETAPVGDPGPSRAWVHPPPDGRNDRRQDRLSPSVVNKWLMCNWIDLFYYRWRRSFDSN